LGVPALAGIVILLRRPRAGRGPAFMWAMPALLLAAAVVIIGSTRYRAPLYPFMAILAAIALTDVWDRIHARIRGPRPDGSI
jgi:hypothetical protein